MADTKGFVNSDEQNAELAKPTPLTGPGFPPLPTEPAKPHTEAELNKLGQSLESNPMKLVSDTTDKDAADDKK